MPRIRKITPGYVPIGRSDARNFVIEIARKLVEAPLSKSDDLYTELIEAVDWLDKIELERTK